SGRRRRRGRKGDCLALSGSFLDPKGGTIVPMPSTSSNSARLSELLDAEEERYRASHPRSLALAGQAAKSLLNGVPMSWMTHWATPFPLFMRRANGTRL